MWFSFAVCLKSSYHSLSLVQQAPTHLCDTWELIRESRTRSIWDISHDFPAGYPLLRFDRWTHKKNSFHLPSHKAERETVNFVSAVRDFWQRSAATRTLSIAVQSGSRAQRNYPAMSSYITNRCSLWDRLYQPRRQISSCCPVPGGSLNLFLVIKSFPSPRQLQPCWQSSVMKAHFGNITEV